MHVIVVSDYAWINGGAAHLSIVTSRALAESGVRVTHFCGSGPVSEKLHHPLITVKHLGLEDVWNIPGKARAVASSIWNGAARRALRAVVEESRGETIVHVHQWTRCLSPSIFSALDGVPWAVSLHDYFFLCPTGLLYVAPRQRTCELRPMSPACIACNCDTRSYVHKAVRVVRQAATGLAVAWGRSSPNFIHVSNLAKAVALPHLPSGARHFVVPNACDVVSGGKVNVRNNRAFVYIGRFQREKGVLDFAEAARRADVAAIFLGGGPEEAAIRALNPAAEIRPWGPRAAVEEVLRSARCLVLPSRWNETFGLTVLEAHAVGVPAIVARNSGAAEVVEKFGGGVVVEGASIERLTSAIRMLAADDEKVETLGDGAFKGHASGYWGSTAYGERLMSCYKSLLSGVDDDVEADRTQPVA